MSAGSGQIVNIGSNAGLNYIGTYIGCLETTGIGGGIAGRSRSAVGRTGCDSGGAIHDPGNSTGRRNGVGSAGNSRRNSFRSPEARGGWVSNQVDCWSCLSDNSCSRRGSGSNRVIGTISGKGKFRAIGTRDRTSNGASVRGGIWALTWTGDRCTGGNSRYSGDCP